MSRANGACKFPDGKILYFLYNGTVDVCVPKLLNTIREAWDNYLEYDPDKECTCGREEYVELYTDYGGGSWWEAKACRYCMWITDRLTPSDEIRKKEDCYPEESYMWPEIPEMGAQGFFYDTFNPWRWANNGAPDWAVDGIFSQRRYS